MDNATRRQLLEQAKQVGYTGSILDVFHNPQVLDQFVQEQQPQQPQPQIEMPTPPATTPNYKVPQPRQSEAQPLVMSNTEVPIQIRKTGGVLYDKGGPKQREVVYTNPEEFKIANQAYQDSTIAAGTTANLLNAIDRYNRNAQGYAPTSFVSDAQLANIYGGVTKTGSIDPISYSTLYTGRQPWQVKHFKNPETKPVLQEAPQRIEPLPMQKLPVTQSQLEPVNFNLNIQPQKSRNVYQSDYTMKTGQRLTGRMRFNPESKKWESKPIDQEELDYYNDKNRIDSMKESVETPTLKKSPGVMKFDLGGPKDKGWREYKTATGQSFFLDPRFKNQRYYVDEKGNTFQPDQNSMIFDVESNAWEGASLEPTLKISAKEATPALASIPSNVKNQAYNQGTIKPATTGAQRLANQFMYAMDQPLDALGSLIQRGYVPEGNLNGDYETASPMSSVIGAFNPVSVIMDIGRVGRDAFEKETYTTWGGAGEGLMNVAGFLPFGSIVQKGLKNVSPKTYHNRNISEFFEQNNLGEALHDMELKNYTNLERKTPISVDVSYTNRGYANPTRLDQQQEFKNAEEFAKKWAYDEEALNTYEKEIIPKRKKLEEDYDVKLLKIEEDSNKLKDEALSIDKMLDDPNNSENFDKLHERYNQLINEGKELDRLHNATRIERNKLADELTNSVNIYNKDFERKALDIINSERDEVSKHTRLFNKKFDTSRNKLVYYDKSDPSYKNLNATEQLYLDGNVDRIGGARMQDSTISLATEGRPLITTHLVTEKLPWSFSNPLWTKKKQYLQDVIHNNLIDPTRIGHVNAHEIAHDLQKLNEWSDELTDYNPAYSYYTSNSNTKLGKQFEDALVSPDIDPWLSAPIELHSELMGARYQAVKNMMEGHGLTMDQAIKVLKEDTDDYTDYLIKIGNLNRHFKPETTIEEKRRLIKMLPAAIPALGAGYVGSQLYNNQQQQSNREKGFVSFKTGGKKCYTCNQSKLQVLYNKRNYKK